MKKKSLDLKKKLLFEKNNIASLNTGQVTGGVAAASAPTRDPISCVRWLCMESQRATCRENTCFCM